MKKEATARSVEGTVRIYVGEALSFVEVIIYVSLGTLLGGASLVGIAGAAHLLWIALRDWTGATSVFLLIDRLLFVLMQVEILHTVRISIRSHKLVVEPFLIVGLIASIRRMLVLTLQAESMTSASHWSTEGKPLFEASMIELGVLAMVIAVLVAAIVAMRRTRTAATSKAIEPFVSKSL